MRPNTRTGTSTLEHVLGFLAGAAVFSTIIGFFIWAIVSENNKDKARAKAHIDSRIECKYAAGTQVDLTLEKRGLILKAHPGYDGEKPTYRIRVPDFSTQILYEFEIVGLTEKN